jgi:hypothetical protein
MKRATLRGHLAIATILVVVATSCGTAKQVRLPPPADRARIAAAFSRWGSALQQGDAQALADAEDRFGQSAIVYTAIKFASTAVPGGEDAVRVSFQNLFLMSILQIIWPDYFSEDVWPVAVPPWLSPTLVAIGLAQGDPNGAIIPVSRSKAVARFDEAQRARRQRLMEAQAWTCALGPVVRTITSDAPVFAYGKSISPWYFEHWARTVDKLWIVAARCADRSAAVMITGSLADHQYNAKVLAVQLLPTQAEKFLERAAKNPTTPEPFR